MSERKPRAWMRRWAFVGEFPRRELNPNTGRMALPGKFKFRAVTVDRCLSDDVPLYASEDLCGNDAEIVAKVAPDSVASKPEKEPSEDGSVLKAKGMETPTPD